MALLRGARTVVFWPVLSRRAETERTSRVKPAKMLMFFCVLMTSERMTAPVGRPVEGLLSSSLLGGSWMPGPLGSIGCWAFGLGWSLFQTAALGSPLVRKGISWAWEVRRRVEVKRAVAIDADFMVGRAFVGRRCGSRSVECCRLQRKKYVTHVIVVGDGM